MKTKDMLTKQDIDLRNKLENMLDCELSKGIVNKCLIPRNYAVIKQTIWDLLCDESKCYATLEWFEELGKNYLSSMDYESKECVPNIHDFWAACLYDCDLIYMQAIAMVFDLDIPKTSSDVHIFGIKNNVSCYLVMSDDSKCEHCCHLGLLNKTQTRYCNCGDSPNYEKPITQIDSRNCEDFEL